MRSLFKNKTALIFAGLLLYLYFRGIGDHGLIDPLEGVNSSVEVHMLATGNYFVPKVGDELVAGKSLLTWWLSALAIKIFGWGEFSVRFLSALSGALMILSSAISARRSKEYSSRKSWLAASICASMSICFTVSQIASSHAVYACLTGLALMYILKGFDDKNYFVQAHICIVLAFMAHGAGGFVFPFMAMMIFAALNFEYEKAVNFFTWPPAALISVSGIGCYILMLMYGNGWVLHFMRCEHLSLDLENILGYVLFAFAAFIPWHGFIINSARNVFLNYKDNPRRTFMLIWSIIFGLAAILSGDLLSLGTCAPALSALMGDYIDDWLEQKHFTEIKISAALTLVIIFPAVALLLPLAVDIFPVVSACLLSIVPYGLFMVLFLFACWYYTRTKQVKKWARNIPAAALLCLMPLTGIFDLTAEKLSAREAALTIRSDIQGNNLIIQYEINHPSMYFYTFRNSLLVNPILTPGLQDLKAKISVETLNNLWSGRERIFMIINADNKVPNNLTGHIYRLLDDGEVLLLSNK